MTADWTDENGLDAVVVFFENGRYEVVLSKMEGY